MAEVDLKEVLDAAKAAAREDYDRSMGPQFRDMRCKACNHDRDAHRSDGNCYECPIERRCQRYVIRAEAVK